MGNIFRYDSPFMQKLAMVGNLILLNVLWLLFSLPVVTAGAATAALYHTVFQFQTEHEDAVLKPFLRGFTKNFKQATLIWIALLAIMALMAFNFRYLFAYDDGSSILWMAIIIVSVAVLLVQAHLLPQVARFDSDTRTIVKNAGLLTALHMPSAILMTGLNILPVVVFFVDLTAFMQWSLLWVGLWFSLVAYLNGKMLLKIWSKHIPQEENTEEKVEENEES